MSYKPRRITSLVINFTDLPEHVREDVRGSHNFNNDIYMEVLSEFDIDAYRDGTKSLTSYFEDQTKEGLFKGTIEEFIESYGLHLDKWIMDQNFDFEGVDSLFIKVCW